MDVAERLARLEQLAKEASGCTRCRLAEGRKQVVFGVGDPTADLMLVGEAPGFHEDKQGYPFVGQAGKLLDRLLEGIGMTRGDVYIANVLKCLRYRTLVQLGDGSWERIGRLVRSRYAGTVMSVDAYGFLVPRRIVGWHATPLAGRRVLRVTYRSAKRAGTAQVNAELTGDHPVLTDRGYVPAEELHSGDRVATGQGISRLARDVVCGTLLGDGTMNANSAYLGFSHSSRQVEYAEFKASLLEELEPRMQELPVAAVAGGPTSYGAVHVRTLAHRALGLLRTDFYGPRKQVPEWMENDLNERMLAIWFMDDGYTRIRPPRQPLAEIATNGFSETDLQILLRALARLNLPAKTLRGRIYFDVHATKALSERIARYVPPPMRYKLHPDVEATIAFDEASVKRDPPEVMFDDVEVEDVTDCPRTDTTFFCIDVDETHNFVTAGGVVHNCRPPGNRDPVPDEIQSCEPYLFRQVELVEPRVVGTLGNFATKLLSGKQTGITRVHGQPQDVVLGGRPVLLYPLYHPAAALYTPRMLAVLEEDFARLPDLLARSSAAAAHDEVDRPPEAPAEPEPVVQLGLF
jgi:uracil-DNA glycosylase